MPGSSGWPRLAIVTTHPIQYYAPWFRYLTVQGALDVRVFYLLKPSDTGLHDPYFGREIRWDVPLYDGYAHEFVPNIAARPGVGRFWGFRNPELLPLVRAFDPDAVLLLGYNYWAFLRFIFTWPLHGAPLLFRGDSHRLVARVSMRARVRGRLLAWLFKRFAAFLYVGEANRRYFEMHGVDEDKLFHAPHAIDNERFHAAAAGAAQAAREWRVSLGVPEENAVILFAGKLEAKKRPGDLLSAFADLNCPDASLVFVGDGPLEGRLREAARPHRNVHFAPFQNQSLMPRTYCAADIVVLPSFGEHETWGLAVNEAMACGKPVIVSSHVGCAEDLVRRDPPTGLVFRAGDADALRGALATALEQRERLPAWGANARKLIAQYGYAEASAGLSEALRAVLRSPDRASAAG